MKIYSKECEVNNNDYFTGGKVINDKLQIEPQGQVLYKLHDFN